MNNYPEYFRNEEELEEALSKPTPELVDMMQAIEGDFIFLGVAGKMGVSMARMAKRACEEAGVEKRIVGVSRFSDMKMRLLLEDSGIETIKGDLVDHDFIQFLPELENVVYLAGMKFGTDGNESFTWAMNAYLPGMVADKFRKSRIVAFSTGCVYPLVDKSTGGSIESDPALPVGEYAQSCLGRERLFEFGSIKYNTQSILIRLNYSVETRYGVLVDIANKIQNNELIDLTMGYANVIWQGDANNMILRAFDHCQSPAVPLNISGPEILSVREVAIRMGELMGKQPQFKGEENPAALLVNCNKAYQLLGKPKISLDQVIHWTADWVGNKRRLLGKPTHFEVRDGKY